MPTAPDGTIVVDRVWKRFPVDLALPLLQDQVIHMARRIRGQAGREHRWVLRDINLRVEPGQTQALVGVNGSGKTTLLKIISKTTFPTAGRISVEGRIGALLDVRSGIHPDLTGRENIFLFGAILGMTRKQVSQRFDDIVEFAEIASAVDRQVKFYSAGMWVRLGFAIAVCLDPDVLLVDEVLAVGDARFQQKCLDRISEAVTGGTTLLYVSHDLATVQAVCERAMWLADSVVKAEGPTREVLSLYRASVGESSVVPVSTDGRVRVLKTEITAADGGVPRSGEPVDVRLVLRAPESIQANVVLGVTEGTAAPVFVVRYGRFFPEGEFEVRCRLSNLPLPKGSYALWASIRPMNVNGKIPPYLAWQPLASFEAFGPEANRPPPGVTVMSPVYVPAEWDLG